MAEEEEKKTKPTDSLLEAIKTIVYALLIAGLFRTLFFQPFWIPSASMKDTLLVGDFLFVNKMAYGYSYASCPKIQIPAIGLNLDVNDFCGFIEDRKERIWGAEPKRGDVVVFRHPDTGIDFIKRLIGLPGDRIQMREGLLFINETAVGLEKNGQFVESFEPQGSHNSMPVCRNRRPALGTPCLKEKYIETLPGGVSHSVLNIARTSYDDTGVFRVPAGHYFFMGDNRDNSDDSRGSVGFVPLKDIVGRADRILFSSAGRSILAFWTWRKDRYFKAIK